MKKISKRWRVTALCTLVGGAIVVAPVVALTGLVSASTAVQDTLSYLQQRSGLSVVYQPVGGTAVTQTLTGTAGAGGSGKCSRGSTSNPTVTNPLLPLTASYYASGYASASTTAPVGASSTGDEGTVYETGVCALQPSQTIEVKEGLVFSVGQSNALTKGRFFTQASIPVYREDESSSSLKGTLVLRRSGSVVGNVPFTLTGDDDTPVLVNTGVFSQGFDQLEVQVDSPSVGSLAVVGPISIGGTSQAPTFFLASASKISSANQATFTVGGGKQSFSVTTTGYPNPALTNAAFNGCTPSTLPSSISFSTTNGSGTATISGSPVSGDGGTYTLCLNATNAGGSASQAFTLTIDQAPAITSTNTVTFTAGSSGSNFMVTTTGYPVAALSESGSLPSGVTFTDNGTGTATITNSPAAGTGGSYAITITAANGVSPNATQSFTLIVDQPPAITSAASTTFSAGNGTQSFNVTATGYPGGPTLKLSESGSLPSGVTFTDNGNGTATIANSTTSTGGSYPITITAANGVSPNATQSFTLIVDQPPTITSASSVTFAAGGSGSDFTVTTAGYPGGPTLTLGESGPLPSGVTFTDNGDGTATITNSAAADSGGSYKITITASNTISPDATQSFTIDVNQAPAFTSQPTDIVPAGSSFSYSVTTSGNPTPAITNASFAGCTPSTLPSSVSFADNGGTATISGNPADGDAGTYTLCLNATNGVSPAATQSFTLVITAPGAPFEATQENGSPVAASIQLNSGSKSFVDFTTSGDTKGDETVEWNTTNGTGTYNATAVLTWVVPICNPGTGPSPECGPTDIAFTVNGTPQPQTFCLASSPPSDPNSSNWCTTNIAYSFLDPGNTGKATETQITETWNGQGDPTWSR